MVYEIIPKETKKLDVICFFLVRAWYDFTKKMFKSEDSVSDKLRRLFNTIF